MSSGQAISGHMGRDQWMRALAAASDLSPRALRLTLWLSAAFNCKTGQCDPGHPTLAKGLQVSKRTVSRAIDELETAGWISVDRTGGDNTRNAQINLLIPSAGETRSGDNMLSPEKEPKGAASGDNILSPENPSLQVTENAPSVDRKAGFQVTDRVAAQITCEPENLNSPAVPAAGRTSRVDRESDNSAETDGPVARTADAALHQPAAEPEQQTPRVDQIGTAAHGARTRPGFEEVRRSARELFGAKGDAVATRLLAALGNDFEDAMDTLACAADEADPMNYLKLEVERQRPRENDAENPWRTNDD
ncbi:helix-turn-helix domain-containing protein [Bradyrhizobium sp. 482_C4_N1_1]|uniref:helix-turn-helix domain-containing protein n=1 Tax=unclassified Bradyrhizobium TaxID=2631580 RepID=UPI003391639A